MSDILSIRGKNIFANKLIYYRFPVVSVGIIRWVECTVTEPSYFKLCTEHCPVHLALLDEVVVCHPLLHPKILRLLVHLFESKQDELEILVQVSIFYINNFSYQLKIVVNILYEQFFSHLAGNEKDANRQNGEFVKQRLRGTCCMLH